jgi:hypothetical protein
MLALAPSFMQHAAHEFTGAAPLEFATRRAFRTSAISPPSSARWWE